MSKTSHKPKIIIIVGPNASGKSNLAVKIAKKNKGEIISADSRQIYKGLNIATGKIAKKEMAGIPHHLLDIAEPDRQFSVAEFKKEAQTAIEKIIKRGNIPIVVGGTGFWIDSLVYDLNLPSVPPDQNLRKKLVKKSAPQLLEILKKIDPRRAQNIEQKNPLGGLNERSEAYSPEGARRIQSHIALYRRRK